MSEQVKPRVTVYVSGGVAEVAESGGVEVEVIDWDSIGEDRNIRDAPDDYDPDGHPGPSLRAWLDAMDEEYGDDGEGVCAICEKPGGDEGLESSYAGDVHPSCAEREEAQGAIVL